MKIDDDIVEMERKLVQDSLKVRVLEKECRKETRPLRKKVEKVEERYGIRQRRIHDRMEETEKRKGRLEQRREIGCMREEFKKVQKKGKVEDEREFKVMMMLRMNVWKSNVRRAINFSFKIRVLGKQLNNGITLVRLGDDMEDQSYRPYSKYFALVGLKVVGYYHCRNAEHMGDSADRKSWIGLRQLRSKNDSCGRTFHNWKAILGEVKNPIKLREIDLLDKTNQEYIFRE